tara:strand:+ start:2112 stop:2519 length:408 start_codon:yes stop_codon:yes gene_type:complete
MCGFFLIRDGHMPAENITLLEAMMIDGGALDGAGNGEECYLVRGGHEMDMTYQNFWDVFSEIPALELPAPFTVLDEYRIVNDADKNWSKARLLEKRPDQGLFDHGGEQATADRAIKAFNGAKTRFRRYHCGGVVQ